MENNSSRQQGVGNFGEVREDVFADPLGGEAVSKDAGRGDWGGGLLDWDSPQEKQHEQGYVEGEYDHGFIPKGEYTPGSEYDPGLIPESGDDLEGRYDPLFTWGGGEDDVVSEEPVDVSAADHFGGTQPLGT